MVPESASILAIGIVVVFVFFIAGDVICITVEGGTSVRAVEMDGAGSIAVIDKSDYGFFALVLNESGSWDLPVIANETSFLHGRRIDLYLYRLDVDLIIIYEATGMVVGHSHLGFLYLCHGQWHAEEVLVNRTEPSAQR